MSLNESIVENAALEWFGELGYSCLGAEALAPTLSHGERESYGEVVLVGRLREAIRRLNPAIPDEAREEALRKVLRVGTPALTQTNRAFHRMLRDGIPVEFLQPEPSPQPSPSGRGRSGAEGEGQRRWDIVRLIDFEDVRANDWLAVNQFTVIEGQHNRRPDIVVFVNGLPLGLIELKNAADEDATIWSAYAQLQTYKAEIPTLLHYNAALVVSDGLQARMGSVTANQEWFKVWREPDGSPPPSPQPSPSGRGSEHYRGGFDIAGLTDKARELRRNQTPAEDVLWELLRDRQLMGAKFRRQHQFGEYICDFFCHDAKLVVECDGEPHSEAARIKHDAKRDAYLRSQGLTVIRFENQRVLNDTDAVLSEIAAYLPSPAGRRAGDEGQQLRPKATLELQTLIYGVFERERFLKLLLHFIVFEEDPDSGALHKIIAGYHQFHAVNAAVEETVRASGMTETGSVLREDAGTYWAGRQRGGKPGDRRAGVVWHTQGSGKSFSMLFFAARVVRHPAMQNPTLVVLTDRNDLDDQLFGQFQRCADILGQTPVQASGREHLRELLNRASGGVVFTTIHKFMPAAPSPRPSPSGRGRSEAEGEGNVAQSGRMEMLSDRRNIVVIADEAHRSQYGFGGKVNTQTGEMSYGFASNLRDALPNASFIGFTGTPIEKTDANTRAVFGDYISIYDIQRAVADKATVPIYYESRISKLSLNAAELPKLDAEFEEITEGEELTKKEKLKTKWAALEALVGDPKRIALVAADLVAHFEKRLEAMDGKAMVVCMSRRICVDHSRFPRTTKSALNSSGAKNRRHTPTVRAHTSVMDDSRPQMTPEFAQRLAAAQSSLYAFIVSLMGGRDEAADVLQETNLKLCREFHRYDESKPFINWALTLARFEVMEWRTRQSRSRLVLDNDVAERVAAALEVAAVEPERELAALEHCLQKLPERQRALVEERYQRGETVRAMAGRMGQPENALAAMLYRIRRTLQECITATLAKEESA